MKYQIILPGHESTPRTTTDAAKVGTDEVLRTNLHAKPALVAFADPTQYWIRRVTEGEAETISFEKIASGCIKCGEMQISVTPTEALNDVFVLDSLRKAFTNSDFSQAVITRSCESGILFVTVSAPIIKAATEPHSEVDDAKDELADLFDNDESLDGGVTTSLLTSLDASVQLDGSKRDTVIEPESTALTLISNDATHAAPLAKQAAPSTVLPASVQLPTAVTANDDVTRAVSLTNNLDAKAVITHNASVGKANTGNAIDAEDEEEDETTDAKSSSPKPTEVIPFAHSLKTITIVLAPNLLDPTQPGLSYAVHAGTVFMQVGVSSLDMFGPLPPLVQAMLNEAERQWDTLIATQVAREAAAVEAKAAAQAETQQKAMEAKAAKAAAKKKPARKNGTHLNAAPSSSASVARSTTVALPAVTDEEEDDSGDPAEVTLTPVSTAMKETTQDSLFG